MSGRTLVPIMGVDRVVGHVLATCKGFRTCDDQDRTMGYFETMELAVFALLRASEAPPATS